MITHAPTLTQETAAFLMGLVNTISIKVGEPDFDEALERVLAARKELGAILAHVAVDEPAAPNRAQRRASTRKR